MIVKFANIRCQWVPYACPLCCCRIVA